MWLIPSTRKDWSQFKACIIHMHESLYTCIYLSIYLRIHLSIHLFIYGGHTCHDLEEGEHCGSERPKVLRVLFRVQGKF